MKGEILYKMNSTMKRKLEFMTERRSFKPNIDYLAVANNPDRIIDFIYYLKRKHRLSATKELMAEHFNISYRQICFYSQAGAQIFGFFDTSKNGVVTLTRFGLHFAYLKKDDIRSFMINTMLKLPIIHKFRHHPHNLDRMAIEEYIKTKETWRKHYSDASIKRRADSIQSWVNYIHKHQTLISPEMIIDYLNNQEKIENYLEVKNERKTAV